VIDIAGGEVTVELPNEVEPEPDSDGVPKRER